MAHEIFNNDVMFSLAKDTKPWHGLGDMVETITEELLLTGVGHKRFVFEVEQQPLFTANGIPVDHVANVRKDNGAVLAVVGGSTHAPEFGYKHMVDFCKPLVDSGAMEIATAGTLRNGKRAYISLRFLTETMEADIATGDTVAAFLMLRDVLDGTSAASINLCVTRPVCANTVAIAEREAEKFGKMRFNHCKNYVQTMEQFRDAVNVAKRNFELTVSQYKALASRNINQADLQKYVSLCLDIPETTLPNESKALNTILNNFNKSEVASTEGTWWKAYNSAQAYLQWQIGSSNTPQQRRTDNLVFGPQAAQNRLWLNHALSMSGVSV